jgi:hypothetical protein
MPSRRRTLRRNGASACEDPPPKDTLGYAFYMHACPRGVAWGEVKDRCLTAIREARSRGISVFLSGNDSRYVVGAMAKNLGIAAGGGSKKGKKKSGEVLLDVLEELFQRDLDDQNLYAMPNLFKATYYNNDRSLREVEVRLTGAQVALSFCGALLTYVGEVRQGLEGQIYLLVGLEDPVEHEVLQILLGLVRGYRDAPIKDASFALKRLYLSAYVDKPIEPVELFIARGNRATLISATRLMLYDLHEEVKKALAQSIKLLTNNKVLDYATKLASLLELFFESTYRQVGEKKYRRVEWLYEGIRVLEALANMKTEDEDMMRAKRYAEIMLPAVRHLIKDALAEI